MRAVLVARRRRVISSAHRTALVRALSAWRAESGVWETFAFAPSSQVGFGIVVVADASAMQQLVTSCPLAPYWDVEVLEVEPATEGTPPDDFRVVTLREARRAQGLSMQDLAERAGVGQATVRRAERGKAQPRSHVARRLAAALGLDPDRIAELRGRAGMVTPLRHHG